MNAKRGFTLIEFMIMIAIVGIVLAIVAPAINMNQEMAMQYYVKTLYQPNGEVRVSCAGQRCTAVFTDRQEREKTVVADCGMSGCAAVVAADR